MSRKAMDECKLQSEGRHKDRHPPKQCVNYYYEWDYASQMATVSEVLFCWTRDRIGRKQGLSVRFPYGE